MNCEDKAPLILVFMSLLAGLIWFWIDRTHPAPQAGITATIQCDKNSAKPLAHCDAKDTGAFTCHCVSIAERDSAIALFNAENAKQAQQSKQP